MHVHVEQTQGDRLADLEQLVTGGSGIKVVPCLVMSWLLTLSYLLTLSCLLTLSWLLTLSCLLTLRNSIMNEYRHIPIPMSLT